MKVLILAAGEGKRLRPYTNEIPKCMVKLSGYSLLSHQLSSIKKCNVSLNDVALVGGYQFDALKIFNIKTYKNTRYETTNMVTTLFCARDFMIHGEDLIISYGDIIFEERVLRAILDCDEAVCVAANKDWERLWRLRMSDPLEDVETFVMDNDRVIKELGQKPTAFSQVQAQYMGLIKIRGDKISEFKETYDRMDKKADYDGQNFDNMYMTSFIQYLIDSGWQVKATLVKGGWLEVDTVSDLKCYKQMAKDGSLDKFCML